MKTRRWVVGVGVGFAVGIGTQVLFGALGIGAGSIATFLVITGRELADYWERRTYRLTREQAFRLHQQMLDYATTDAWTTTMRRKH